jgi:hypothetical protein
MALVIVDTCTRGIGLDTVICLGVQILLLVPAICGHGLVIAADRASEIKVTLITDDNILNVIRIGESFSWLREDLRFHFSIPVGSMETMLVLGVNGMLVFGSDGVIVLEREWVIVMI